MRFVWPALAFLVGLVPLIAPLAPVPHPALTIATALWIAVLVRLAPRRPEWALLLTAPLFAVNNVWAQAVTVFVVFTASRRITRPGRLWALLGIMTVLQCAFSQLQESYRSMPLWESIIGAVLGSVFFVLFPAVSGMLLGRRKPMVRLLQERNEYLERARALTAASARSEERAHIAGEMHDMLGHRLSLISIHAGALELATARKPQLHEQAELIRTTSSLAMAELREILGVLRTNPEPESLDEDTGTRSDIAALAESSSASLDWSGEDLHGADPRTRRAVQRVVREALTNVRKHAPHARTRVQVSVQGGRARIQVVNGPSGGPPAKGARRGLIGLEERVGLLGGSFSAGPPVEGGFRVAVDVPLHPSAQAVTEVREVPPPLAAEVLTVPRVVGSGCLGLLALLPIAGALTVLLLFALLNPTQMNAPYFDSLRVGVTTDEEVMGQFGLGQLGVDGCSRFQTSHNPELLYKLCFRDGKLHSKTQEKP